ncbi:hypothetical protein [Psychroserpens sp.]|uniref:hypothetical protein n=1 Tax=Psychroserpens sp. TaxID=2020870 RepID=UPI002B276834|nr:hypothetical protein [Psychroserpens sp.]
MRKLAYLFALLFIGVNYTSCTPENIVDKVESQACCDEGEHIPPPPPPPDPNTGG